MAARTHRIEGEAPHVTRETLVFGAFRLDLRDEQLWRGQEPVPLKAKALAVLCCLVTNAGQLMTKEAIFAAVWPATVVSESVLTVAIRQLRLALGDHARTPQYIQTVHGRGYRFITPVIVADRPPAKTPAPAMVPFPPPSARVRPDVFVGRDRELAAVLTWFDAARHGSRRVGFIAGEPGIGKTTLVNAVVAHIVASGTAWVGRGQCIQHYGAGEAYLPVLEALGRLIRAPEGRQLGDILRHHAPSWLAHLPALLSPEERQAYARHTQPVTSTRMIRELAEALEVLTAAHPLIMVLEDLHWSDTATLEWLSYVARRHDPARLLILGTYRPVDVIVRAPLLRQLLTELRTHANGAEIVLDYLSEAAVVAYLRQRLHAKPFPSDLAHLLHQRTTGNPLFLTAVIDELVRLRMLVEGEKSWDVSGDFGALASVVPTDLQHLITQHIEHLSSDDQAILEAASVVGPNFSVAAVAAGVPLAEADIEARCTTWTRQDQFVLATGTETWPDGTVAACYRFRHALYHEVVYARVSAGQRRRLHGQIGNCLEAHYGEQAATIAAELAVHFERGGADQRAVVYLLQAAENAKRRSAYPEALAHLSRGLEVVTRLPSTPDRGRYEFALQRARGAALVVLKGYAAPEVAHAYGRARLLGDQFGNASERFPAIYGLYAFHIVRAELQTARGLAMQLFALAQDQIASAFAPVAHFGLGVILAHTGEPGRALAHLDQASALYDPRQHETQVAQHGVDCGVFAHACASHTLWLLGYPDQALARGHAALSLARQLSHPFSIVLSLAYLAMLEQFRGAAQAVSEHAVAAVALSAEQGFNYYLAWGRFLQAWARLTGDRDGGTMASMRQSLAALEATGAGLRRPYYLSLMAQACGRAGQVDDALALVAGALAEAQTTGEHWWDAELYRLRGSLFWQREAAETPQAEASFRQALEVARRQQARALECRAAMSLSRLWHQQGKRHEARALLAPISHWFTEGFDSADFRAAQTLLQELA
jgi:DNA-binding winged helix-turn-helix (wHTH) protein/predicted ATPase